MSITAGVLHRIPIQFPSPDQSDCRISPTELGYINFRSDRNDDIDDNLMVGRGPSPQSGSAVAAVARAAYTYVSTKARVPVGRGYPSWLEWLAFRSLLGLTS